MMHTPRNQRLDAEAIGKSARTRSPIGRLLQHQFHHFPRVILLHGKHSTVHGQITWRPNICVTTSATLGRRKRGMQVRSHRIKCQRHFHSLSRFYGALTDASRRNEGLDSEIIRRSGTQVAAHDWKRRSCRSRCMEKCNGACIARG
ncbi:TPA: hypothetical protein N0F65_006153, partial [Lagenidium giganteum]